MSLFMSVLACRFSMLKITCLMLEMPQALSRLKILLWALQAYSAQSQQNSCLMILYPTAVSFEVHDGDTESERCRQSAI